MTDEREVIPAGRQPGTDYKHLVPIARFLIEQRNHMPIQKPEKFGFVARMGGLKCHLARGITDEDWAAINQHFVVPDNIVYFMRRIVDQDNSVELVGHDSIMDVDGEIPIEVWEERQRAQS